MVPKRFHGMFRLLGVNDNSPICKCLEKGQDSLNCFKMSFSKLGNILNLLIANVVHAISNLPKTIIQIHQPIIDLYLSESSSVHRGESSISGWYPSLMGVMIGLNSSPKKPSNFGMKI
jgi:hypothetical protein